MIGFYIIGFDPEKRLSLRRMNIGINARFLLDGRLEGLGRFSHEVLQRMVKSMPEHDFHFYFDRPYHRSFIYAPNVVPHVVYPPARHPILYYLWFDWALPFCFKRDNIQLFFSPDGFLSLRTDIPQIPVIHDLAFEHYPQFVSGIGARYYKYFFPLFAQKAAHIATVSEFTKQDLMTTYGQAVDKISVVYNGSNEHFTAISNEEQEKIKLNYTKGRPYFVYVGALQPRKNVGNLLKAFDLFKQVDQQHYQLVIVGRKAWQTEEMERIHDQMFYKEDVVFTGRVSDELLSKLLAASRALVYIPFFEGFGLPLLEAFSCGVPAIASNVSSLPEVAGKGAILTDVEDIGQISEAMHVLSTNEQVFQLLRREAKTRALEFSWQKTSNACATVLKAYLPDSKTD